MKTYRMNGGLTLISILYVLILACSPAAQPAAPTGGDQTAKPAEQRQAIFALEEVGQTGGKLSMAAGVTIFGNPNDPHLFATVSGRNYAVPVTNGMVKRDIYDPKYGIIPDLAEKWDVSKDGLSYTFKLRQGIKFQNVAPLNGREFTSEDAKYTLMRIMADPSIVPEKSRARFQRKGDFGPVKSIETPDKYTMVVNMKEPFAPLMDAMSHPATLVIPKEFVDKFPDGLILEGMVGTGPYIPAEFINQRLMSFKKNPNYWNKDSKGNQLPYLDEVRFVAFSEETSRLASFRASQVDTSGTVSQGSTVDAIKKDIPSAKVLYTAKASLNTFRFNTKAKPFDDVRVRKAISLAVDRYQWVDLFSDGRGAVAGPVTPLYTDLANTADWLLSQPGYRKDKTQDITEAKRLLKEVGYGDGFTTNVMYTSAAANAGDYAALFADQMKPLNITAKAEIVDYAGQWLPRSTNGEFEINQLGYTLTTDADSLLSAHLHSAGARNYGKFNDPKLDDLIVKQRTTVNPEERKKWAQEA
ncbi:MAG: hypothetical protein EXR50_03680 [Dehalococcoidia bacterium]|nr:hypothetical protein [Dehalococcoidia bacterium]